jgi:hypothetical protein
MELTVFFGMCMLLGVAGLIHLAGKGVPHILWTWMLIMGLATIALVIVG